MSIKSLTTTTNLSPYLGRSKHLIDIFLVLGYEEKSLLELSPNILEKENELEITIISNIISDSSLSIIKQTLIKDIYPEKPNIKIVKSENQKNITSTINSSCYNNADGKQKIFYSYYALKFYEKFIDSKNEYYVPKAFVIISEYPYFTTFHKICMYLYKAIIENNKSSFPIELFLFSLLNYVPSPLKNNLSLIFEKKEEIIIPRLTGYPYLEFNLCNLLYSMPIKEFLKIYILSFLDINLLFFSKDLEKLNLMMFMIMNLNYPLVDGIYFWYIKTFSQEQIKDGFDINQNTFRGINTEYNSKLNLSNFENLYYIVNEKNQLKSLENKNKDKDKDKDKENINKILELLNLLFQKKQKPIKSYFLAESLTTLRNKLKKIRIDYNEYIKKQKCHNFYTNFYIDNFINEKNREIQEAFYNFNLKIIAVLYESFEFNNKEHDDPKFSEEEKIFLRYLSYSDKYLSYFENFIKYFTLFEEFKIATLFTDECANLKMYDIKNDEKKLENIKYLDIMDKIYISVNNTEVIDFNYIYEEYSKFKEKKEKSKHIENSIKSSQLFNLDKNLINKFLFNSKNKDLLGTVRLKNKAEMNIDKTLISMKIQKDVFTNLSKDYYYNLIIYSIIYIFSITFPFLPIEQFYLYIEKILNLLQILKLFQRYYIYILLRAIYQFYSTNKGKVYLYELAYNTCKKIEYYLKNNSIIQSEDISLIINKFVSEPKDKHNICETKGKDGEENDFFCKYQKIESNIKEINNETITNNENTLNFNDGEINIKCNLLPGEFKIFDRSYSLFREFSNSNFEIENYKPDEVIETIVNIIYFLYNPQYKDKEMIPMLYEILNIMNIFSSDLKKIKEKKNENKEIKK